MWEGDRARTVKGALHIHSTFSADGEVSLEHIKALFQQDGFHFLAVCEHQHDINERMYSTLVEECRRLSDSRFLLIPGIEFNCYRNHILGVGITAYSPSVSEDEVVPWIHAHQGFAVWAHPRKHQFQLPDHIVDAIDGIEIWNSKSDGKYAPHPEVLRYFRARAVKRPMLRAVCSVDFHFRTQFRNVPVYCETEDLTTQAILTSLKEGRYCVQTRSFRINSDGTTDSDRLTCLRALNSANQWVFDMCKVVNRRMKRHSVILPAALKDFGRRLLS